MIHQIGRCELDGSRRVLRREGREVAASGLALALLCELATQPDDVVPYARLRSVLWPGVAVEESALRRVVREARRLLGDDGAAARALVTVRGRGLRLVTEPSSAAQTPDRDGQDRDGPDHDARFARDAVVIADVESALLRLDAAPGPDRSEGPDGLGATRKRLELAEAAAAAGRAELAAPAFRRVAGAALANGWAVLLARATRGLAGPYVRYRPPDPALVARLEQALSALGPADDAWRAQLLIRLATEHTLGDLRHRRALQRAAFAAAERSGDPRALAAVLLEPYGQVEEAVVPSRRDAAIDRCAAAAASLAGTAARTPTGVGSADLAFGAALLQLDRCLATGAVDRFDAIYDDVERRARRDGRLLFRWGVALRAGQRALLAGRFADAEQRIEAAFALGQQLEHGQALELFLAQSLVLRIEHGRPHDLAAIRPLLGTDHPSDSARCLVAWALVAIGDSEQARRLALPLLSRGAAALALQPTAIANAALLAELSADLGEPRAAAALDAVLAPHSGRNVLRGVLACHGPVDRYRALTAWLRGDVDTAWRHSEAALALAQRMQATPSCARVHLDRARMLAARGGPGDAARARAEAECAQRLAERAGIETLVARAASCFAPTPDQPSTPASVRP